MNKVVYLYSALSSKDLCVTMLMREMDDEMGRGGKSCSSLRKTEEDKQVLQLFYLVPSIISIKEAKTAFSSCCCFTSCLNQSALSLSGRPLQHVGINRTVEYRQHRVVCKHIGSGFAEPM